MDRNYLAEICNARDVLCGYCESSDCENCQVSKLVNDAFDETDDEE